MIGSNNEPVNRHGASFPVLSSSGQESNRMKDVGVKMSAGDCSGETMSQDLRAPRTRVECGKGERGFALVTSLRESPRVSPGSGQVFDLAMRATVPVNFDTMYEQKAFVSSLTLNNRQS